MEEKEGKRISPKPTYQVYVPPGRRELNEKREREENDRRQQTKSAPPSINTFESATDPLVNTSSRRTTDDDEFRTVIDDDRLAACCLVLSDLPADMSEAGRMRETQPYVRMGALVQWMGNDCCLVFINESTANRALAISTTSKFKPQPLASTSHCNKSFLLAIRDLHSQLKPERDSRVANRLIGAVLGINLSKGSSMSPKRSSAIPVATKVAEEEPLKDAWDDA
eukprot:gene7049-7795_t